MKKIYLLIAILTVIAVQAQPKIFKSVTIDTILDQKISIRAIEMEGNVVWYAADKGRFGYFDTATHEKFESKITRDTLSIEFRSIAQTKENIFILNVGNPALLYKVSKATKLHKLVYHETHEKVFYDSMKFWNELEGIAIGDPINDCLSMIVTRDGGATWEKIPCEKLPKTVDGEAAFAASNTNIVIKGNKTWVVSGGKKSRIFYSSDKGLTWEVFETPIVQGQSMTGAFTADFYNESTGIIAGGNYETPNQNTQNKATTIDGGKTWQLIADGQGFGYASCVQYIPGSAGKQLVSVGANGLQYSSDAGKSWKKLADHKNLFTIRFINATTAIAAGWNGMFKINFK